MCNKTKLIENLHKNSLNHINLYHNFHSCVVARSKPNICRLECEIINTCCNRNALAEFLFHLSLMEKPLFVSSNIDFPSFLCELGQQCCCCTKNFIQYLSFFFQEKCLFNNACVRVYAYIKVDELHCEYFQVTFEQVPSPGD